MKLIEIYRMSWHFILIRLRVISCFYVFPRKLKNKVPDNFAKNTPLVFEGKFMDDYLV